MQNNQIEFVDYIFDRYAFLGLDIGASREEIEAKVKLIRAQNHPDRLTNLSDDLKAQAAQNWHEADICAEVLLNDELRLLYNERLLQFRKDRPAFVTTDSRTRILSLERDYVDIDLLLKGGDIDRAKAEQQAEMISGFDAKKFGRARKLYERETEDADLRGMYKDALMQKVTYHAMLDKFFWAAAGINGETYTESGATIMDSALIVEETVEHIEHVKNEIIPQFIERREGMLALGYDKNPVLLLSGVGETPVQASAETKSKMEEAQSRFSALSETIKENAAKKAETIDAYIDLLPFEIISDRTPDVTVVHLIQDPTGSGDLAAGTAIVSMRFGKEGSGADLAEGFKGATLAYLKSLPQTETSVAILYDTVLNEPFLFLGHAFKKAQKHFGLSYELAVTTEKNPERPVGGRAKAPDPAIAP